MAKNKEKENPCEKCKKENFIEAAILYEVQDV